MQRFSKLLASCIRARGVMHTNFDYRYQTFSNPIIYRVVTSSIKMDAPHSREFRFFLFSCPEGRALRFSHHSRN